MSIWRSLKRYGLLATFVSVLIVLIIFNSTEEFSEHLSTNLNKSSAQSIGSSKWKVLSDGTVIHLGNFSDNSFRSISFVINTNICDDFSSDSLKLLILIESKSDNFDRRQALRETWANRQRQKVLNFRVAFLLGITPNDPVRMIQQRIESESKEFRDILQINITESFKNLTFKSVSGLHWFLERCSSAQFYFKTDDDIFIETNHLIESLKTFQSFKLSESIFCHKNNGSKIIRGFERISDIMRSQRLVNNRLATLRLLRDKFFKYKIHYSQLPGLYYPSYCSGLGYAMTTSVAKSLYSAALTIPYFMMEDVFVTGFCREKAKIEIFDAKQLTLRPVVDPYDGMCALKDQRITTNELSIRDMRLFWSTLNLTSYNCS